jgi:predicted DNA-binding transcriptional regulator AlpA
VESTLTLGLLKKADICAQLGISPRTLENLVKSEQFPPGVRIGKWSWWSPKVLVNWRQREFAAQEGWSPI